MKTIDIDQAHTISDRVDTNGLVMGLASGWVGTVSGYAAGAAFGLGGVASGGIGFAVGAATCIAFSLTQHSEKSGN